MSLLGASARAKRRAALALTLVIAGCSAWPPARTDSAASGPAPLSASSAPAALPPTRIVTLHTADGERTAIVHHPASAKAGAAMVVVLHPAATSASTMEANFGWDALADREGLVVVYPDGLLDSFQDTWNAGRCCPPASELRTDDVGFLITLSTALKTIDSTGPRVYAVGFSNGAMLAYAWACARPGSLAGLGVVAGSLTTNCPHPEPVSVVAVHGTADKSVPVNGGPAPDGATFPGVAASLTPFQASDGCPATPTVTSTSVAVVSSWACAGGRRVVRDLVTGLDHAWPGAGAAAGTGIGPLDATGFLWSQLRAG